MLVLEGHQPMSGVLIGVQFSSTLTQSGMGLSQGHTTISFPASVLPCPSLLPVDQNLMPAESGDPTRDTPA